MSESNTNLPARQFPSTPPAFAPPPPPQGMAPSDSSSAGGGQRASLYEHEPSSRELLLGWCFWLLGSWFLLGLGLDGRPVRWMIYSSMIGMLILWPLYRLSQDGFLSPRRRWKWYEPPEGQPAAGPQAHAEPQNTLPVPARIARSRLTPALILRDWFSLNVVFQAVVWPHLLTGNWTSEQAIWVDVVVASWSLLIGAVVAWGCQSSRGFLRGLSMLLVLGILFGEPVVMGLLNQISQVRSLPEVAWQMRLSPIEALYAATEPFAKYYINPWIAPIVSVSAASVLAWLGLLWLTRLKPAPQPHGQPV